MQLPISIEEFERKRVFKCTFVNAHVKEDVSYSAAVCCLKMHYVTTERNYSIC